MHTHTCHTCGVGLTPTEYTKPEFLHACLDCAKVMARLGLVIDYGSVAYHKDWPFHNNLKGHTCPQCGRFH
jgi:hypothetical protein